MGVCWEGPYETRPFVQTGSGQKRKGKWAEKGNIMDVSAAWLVTIHQQKDYVVVLRTRPSNRIGNLIEWSVGCHVAAAAAKAAKASN
eukprot:COSAG06_NODE_11600_length_1486_cov_18.131218_2_plen_87_part_00